MAMPVRGGHCVYLTSLDVDFGWRRMQVYVASEFASGSCEYNSMLYHENQHVAVNNGAVREYAPRFRAEIERILRVQQPAFAANPDNGMRTALKTVDSAMAVVFDQFQDTMAACNAPLDSASNYAATAELCAN